MDTQPLLEDGAVTLRPTRREDWNALFAAAADPAIWALHPQHDRWTEPVFRRYFDEALASGGSLTIREAASGRVIGASRFVHPDLAREEIEIGYTFLVRDHWGGTTNRSIKRLMLRHAHAHFGAAVFAVGTDNLRSRRAMEKIGGVLQVGRHERGNGQILPDHVFYRIARGEGVAA